MLRLTIVGSLGSRFVGKGGYQKLGEVFFLRKIVHTIGIPWTGGSPHMKFTVQLVVSTDDGQQETVLEKEYQRIEHLGLTLTEAKQLLTRLQHKMVERQATAYLAARSHCQVCGLALRVKEQMTRTVRTLFGMVVLASPRLYHCRCQARTTATVRPLTALLTESTNPELLFLETKWASLSSYGMTARVLKDFLPVDETLNATTVQNHTLAVAQRCEEELGEEAGGGIEAGPGERGQLPGSEGPITIGIDGGYVRDWEQKQRHFEVIVGKSIPTAGAPKCFGFVQTYDTKPTQRLGAVLQAQGVPDTQALTFLSDGGETVHNLPGQLHPQAAHWIDWFHLAMRVTVLGQYFKGLLRLDQQGGAIVQKTLESVKWLLWHGKVDKALDRLGVLTRLSANFADTYPPVPTARTSRPEVPYLYREESRLLSQLWPAVSGWGAHLNGVRRIDSQLRDQQTVCEKTVDAMDQTRGPLAATDACQDPEQ
jgi:hypothetical protein